MPRRPKFEHRKTATGWCINVPASITATGKREQHFFKTRDLAKAHGARLREKFVADGAKSNAITPTLAEDATLAAAVLEPWGLSLLEAARLVAGIREKESASKPLTTAADEWLVACEGLRPKTLQGYKNTAKRLKEALGTRLLATLTAEELQTALAPAGTPPSSAAGHLRTGKAFWFWSAEKGWCEAATFKAVKLAKSSAETGEIEILEPEAADILLATAVKHFPQSVASFALQLFAGIRAEEIVRMEEKHVNEDGIDLPAAVTKKGRRRHITPNATLAAWLAKHPFTPCPNWRETSAAVRRLAGWEVVSAIMNERVRVGTSEPLQEPTRGRWPQNALRHSHASYAVASGVALETLLFEFGHTGTANVLREHYVGRASKKQALEFFAIVPEGAKAPATIQPVKKSA
jgi:site-specific recombinase XerD